MAEDRDTEARWYVVHTYSGYENKVAQNLETIVENRRLQELIHEVKVPVELVPDRTARSARWSASSSRVMCSSKW